ncbi:hypothetical protein Aave_1636 [Paracidovorax citrulli AAC00-1]|uniref:Uncharacterized protein n=1 Tax=Paracidovorax citrulli (strain AAC00-1) TaxID=397945 RepID=A1TMN5_PARC0|nr:hypothetical protein Aave_1636 [Paracidovorax citrulli AAC00-1]
MVGGAAGSCAPRRLRLQEALVGQRAQLAYRGAAGLGRTAHARQFLALGGHRSARLGRIVALAKVCPAEQPIGRQADQQDDLPGRHGCPPAHAAYMRTMVCVCMRRSRPDAPARSSGSGGQSRRATAGAAGSAWAACGSGGAVLQPASSRAAMIGVRIIGGPPCGCARWRAGWWC